MLKFGKFTPVSLADIHALEQRFSLRLPEAYKRFVMEHGAGTYCGFIRIKDPATIISERDEHVWFMQNIYYRDEYGGKLTREDLEKAVEIADSANGHKMLALATDGEPDVVILSKWEPTIFRLGRDFGFPMSWTDGIKEVMCETENVFLLSRQNQTDMSYPGVNKPARSVLQAIGRFFPDVVTFEEYNGDGEILLFSHVLGGRIILTMSTEQEGMIEDVRLYFDADQAMRVSDLFEAMRDIERQ